MLITSLPLAGGLAIAWHLLRMPRDGGSPQIAAECRDTGFRLTMRRSVARGTLQDIPFLLTLYRGRFAATTLVVPTTLRGASAVGRRPPGYFA